MALEKPLPYPDAETEPYWKAAREHRLALPRCRACRDFHFYPRSACPHCGSLDLEWTDCSGKGTVYSFTVVQRAPSPAFKEEIPYVVAIVALEEGPHLMTRIARCEPSAVRIDMPVVVSFQDVNEEVSLPVFVPENP